MKKILLLLISLVFVFCVSAQAGIVDSKHDFSSENWSGNRICKVCHTPHKADISVQSSPLWNHEVTTETFQMYDSPTLDSVSGQPGGVSKLCLSCHDGVTAVDSYGGNAGTIMITNDKKIGTDLRRSHPISFIFNSNLATIDGGLHNPSTQPSGLGGTISQDMLFGEKLECSSCHDVHNSFGNSKLLLKNNAQSVLCLTCHNK